MKTPIFDFLVNYDESSKMRLHMPGHKGRALLGIEPLDITEIVGADVLYGASGIIAESERNAAKLFGSGATFYSTEGSSLSIRAMLYLALLYARAEGKEPVIAAARNAHKSFIGAAALLGISPIWIYPDEDCGYLSSDITAESLDAFLKANGEKVTAVYLTSPDYLGNTVDIAALAPVAKKHGALLLVDNAHGAYLAFLEPSRHPIALGAHMCADSAHKTLPALTGAAYLHISASAPKLLAERAEDAMSLFASTSPSYLTLASLDKVNAYLADGYRERLSLFAERAAALKARLEYGGYTLVGDEITKLTLSPKAYGYRGDELAALLGEAGIEVEFCDPDHVVMMLSPEMSAEELDKLSRALLSVPHLEAITEKPPRIARPRCLMSPREAMLSDSEEIPLSEALGRTLASLSISCPPAVPVAVLGEEIDADVISALSYYGESTCRVVK